MGRMNLDSNIWFTLDGPVDAKTIFDTLEQAEQQIPANIRFQGQKFTVKDDSANGHPGPREYWFTEDYVAGVSQGWAQDDDGVWYERFDPEPIIPEPKVYLPADAEGYDDDELRAAISGNYDFITGVSGDLNTVSGNLSGLTSITIGTITSANFHTSIPFPGNLRTVYFAAGGGAGTYVTSNPGEDAVWVKE